MNNDLRDETHKLYSYLTYYVSTSSVIKDEFPTKNLPKVPQDPNKKIADLVKIIFTQETNLLVFPNEINLQIFDLLDSSTRLSILPKVCQQFYLLNLSFSRAYFGLNEMIPKNCSVAKNCIFDTEGPKWFAIECVGPKKMMFHKINVALNHPVNKYGIVQNSTFKGIMKYNRKFFETTLQSCFELSNNQEFSVLDLCEKAYIEAGKNFEIHLSQFSISDSINCNILTETSKKIKTYHSFVSFFDILSEGSLQGIATVLMSFKEIILMEADYTLLECKEQLLSSLTVEELNKIQPLIKSLEEHLYISLDPALSTPSTSKEGCSFVLHKYFKDFILYMTDSSYEECLTKIKDLIRESSEIYRFRSPFKSHLFFLYHCKQLELFCPHGEIKDEHQWFADRLIKRLTEKETLKKLFKKETIDY